MGRGRVNNEQLLREAAEEALRLLEPAKDYADGMVAFPKLLVGDSVGNAQQVLLAALVRTCGDGTVGCKRYRASAERTTDVHRRKR